MYAHGLGAGPQQEISEQLRTLNQLTDAIRTARAAGASTIGLESQRITVQSRVNQLVREAQAGQVQATGPVTVVTAVTGTDAELDGYLGVNDQDQLYTLQRTLHQLALSIQKARDTGQLEAARQLTEQYAAVKDRVDQLVRQLHGKESPSGVSLGLANLFGDAAHLVKWAALGIGAAVLLPVLLRRGGR